MFPCEIELLISKDMIDELLDHKRAMLDDFCTISWSLYDSNTLGDVNKSRKLAVFVFLL